MATTFDYITVTDKNLDSKDAIFDATVVANYGDPGLDEDYHADILSRYVICKLESSNRTLTADRYKNMVIVVKRPEELWVRYQGGFVNDPVNQKRIDANLNTNQGTAANYSINAIPRINNPYQLGEKIKVKLIKSDKFPFLTANDAFFKSECNVWDALNANIGYYQAWHNQGLSSDVYLSQNNGEVNIKQKTVSPTDGTNLYYNIRFNKTQYEAFSLTMFPDKARELISLFSNASSFNYYYRANGGYLFSNVFFANFNFVKYEDMNTAQKARIPTTNCMPLIVTTPDRFTVPKTRVSGTVNYTPTYITKA